MCGMEEKIWRVYIYTYMFYGHRLTKVKDKHILRNISGVTFT